MSEHTIDFARSGDRRSSSRAGQEILAHAVAEHDADLAQRITTTPNWRRDYAELLAELTEVEGRSEQAALDTARAGLDQARRSVVVATDGDDRPIESALAADEAALSTVEVRGTGSRATELVVPYRGRELSGDALLRALDDFVERGIAEPSFAEAIGLVVRNPEWLDLSDRSFALCGAGSALGPLPMLLDWGATVAAVDLPRPDTWQRLVGQAEQRAGRLLAPASATGQQGDPQVVDPNVLGADLLTQTGAIAQWLRGVPGPLTLGNYGYADGGLHVRLTVAVDLIIDDLGSHRDDLSLCYLATPADSFLVPLDAVRMARRRDSLRHPSGLAGRVVRAATRDAMARHNYDTVVSSPHAAYGLVDATILAQGPNYSVAKRLQRWRMELARSQGHLTSVHVAPPSRTESVTHNAAMARRQRLTRRLGIETFDAATVRALAAAVLVHDLRNPLSPANPATPLAHPAEAFMFAANPGGRWRIPLDINSTIGLIDVLDEQVDRTRATVTGAADGVLRRVRRSDRD